MSDDRLLNYLTARGALPIESMREALNWLAPEAEANRDALRAYRAARGLDMLGHAEYSSRGKPARLFIAPPCLARLPIVERRLFVLCGARSARTIGDLSQIAADQRIRVQIEISQNQHSDFMPSKVTLSFLDETEVQRFATASPVRIDAAPAAWALACLADSVAAFEGSLQWRPRSISASQLKLYNPSRMIFEDGHRDGGLAQTIGNSPAYYIIDGEREAPVEDLDYGRYWSCSQQGVACIQYDSRRHLLAVPERLPLPRLMARSLCLCSGQAPLRIEGSALRTKRASLVFSGVPDEIASKLAFKLDIHFIPQPIAHASEQNI